MIKSNIAVLIIAAGYSSRMHDFKPLLPLGKTTALVRLIQTYQAHGIAHIYVVVGHRKDEIIEILKEYSVNIVYNEDYDKGMFSSIQKGLRAIDETVVDAFYMQPVDIPLIKVQSLERLYEAYEREHNGVIYPTFLGRKGHPPLIDMKYKEQILLSDGEGGLKRVLEAFKNDALYVNVWDQSVLMDMDTPDDYQNLLKYEASTPTKEECLAIMLFNEVPDLIIRHCEAVESMAFNVYKHIASFKLEINKNVLSAAALLHDISRQEKNHALVGAQKLRLMGYTDIGDIIETHMDIVVDTKAPLNANELLFLADKLVSEDEICGFEKRFEKAFKKCEGNLEAQSNIINRLNATKAIISKIEILTGKVFSYG